MPCIIVFTYIFFKFLKQFYGTSACRQLIICKQNISNAFSLHLWLKCKRNTYLWILNYQISLLFRFCLLRQLRLLKTKFYRKSKLDTILFCLLTNSAGYSDIKEPIRLRRKHYSPAKYMLMYFKLI